MILRIDVDEVGIDLFGDPTVPPSLASTRPKDGESKAWHLDRALDALYYAFASKVEDYLNGEKVEPFHTVQLQGPPGIGKTALIREEAQRRALLLCPPGGEVTVVTDLHNENVEDWAKEDDEVKVTVEKEGVQEVVRKRFNVKGEVKTLRIINFKHPEVYEILAKILLNEGGDWTKKYFVFKELTGSHVAPEELTIPSIQNVQSLFFKELIDRNVSLGNLKDPSVQNLVKTLAKIKASSVLDSTAHVWIILASYLPGLVFLDEFTLINREDVIASCLKLGERNVGGYSLHRLTQVILAGNSARDSYVVRKVNPSALTNRVQTYEVTYPKLWKSYVKRKFSVLPDDFVAFCVRLVEKFYESEDPSKVAAASEKALDEEAKAFTTLRTMTYFLSTVLAICKQHARTYLRTLGLGVKVSTLKPDDFKALINGVLFPNSEVMGSILNAARNLLSKEHYDQVAEYVEQRCAVESLINVPDFDELQDKNREFLLATLTYLGNALKVSFENGQVPRNLFFEPERLPELVLKSLAAGWQSKSKSSSGKSNEFASILFENYVEPDEKLRPFLGKCVFLAYAVLDYLKGEKLNLEQAKKKAEVFVKNFLPTAIDVVSLALGVENYVEDFKKRLNGVFDQFEKDERVVKFVETLSKQLFYYATNLEARVRRYLNAVIEYDGHKIVTKHNLGHVQQLLERTKRDLNALVDENEASQVLDYLEKYYRENFSVKEIAKRRYLKDFSVVRR